MDQNNSTNVLLSFTKISFFWYDYVLFVLMLLSSIMIGMYFGCFGPKQTTTKDYLMGGKTMKVIPIAISLIASHTSGLTLLSLPADVYRFGAGFWLGVISMTIVAFITVYVYLPVFYNLQITSTYEYLERRFDKNARLFASFLYALSVLLYLPIVIYIPALAFSAATGISVHYITPIVCGICVFYTTIGGLKAVVWTDTLQFTITVGAVITVVMLGVNSSGGFTAVWNRAVEGQRLDIFDFDLDPTKRETFWIFVIGLTTHWLGQTSISQSCVQKFLAVPTLKDSVTAVFYYAMGMNVMKTACVMTGFVMYAKYANCDPFTSKQVKSHDQLLPYYVMDVAQGIPGLSGLFIAGIFSAALSTMSATLNCVSATIYEDFISKILNRKMSENSASNILKGTVVVVGVFSTVMVFVTQHLGGLFQLAISMQGVTNGALLGMFSLGVLCPRSNAKGALYGAVSSLILLSFIVFPAKYFQSQGYFTYPPKPLSTNGCVISLNETILTLSRSNPWTPPAIFRISHYYYTFVGTIICMVIGLAVSYLTNKKDQHVEPNLISPVSQFLLQAPEKALYNSIEKAAQSMTVD